ncbi:MAG: carbonic anhydrase, partial [Phycisphaerales bacterium]|nr:carbonic anhydrase [Phycisphaerales bacterium]
MKHPRSSCRLILAAAAGSCFVLAAGAAASPPSDGHGAPAAEPAGHSGGGAAKPAFQPVPVAKAVSLKAPPSPASAAAKAPGTTEPKAPLNPIKPVSNIKPVGKSSPSANPAGGASADEASTDTPKTADEALAMLREGNQRWLDGSVQNPSVSTARRKATADLGQRPFAVVLTCADSRIPVERVFDRGVGEVFVARVAGNVSGPHESGTIEYALEHLGSPVLVVMGHSKCGAVKATVEGGHVTANIASLLESIKPAVDRAKKLNPSLEGAELVEAAV